MCEQLKQLEALAEFNNEWFGWTKVQRELDVNVIEADRIIKRGISAGKIERNQTKPFLVRFVPAKLKRLQLEIGV